MSEYMNQLEASEHKCPLKLGQFGSTGILLKEKKLITVKQSTVSGTNGEVVCASSSF